MKKVFSENNIPAPEHRIIRSKKGIERLKKAHYPLIVKPITGHAKTNVMLINNKTELLRFWRRNIKKSSFLIENYVAGDEIIAAGIVHQRKYNLIEITDKIKTDLPYFVDLMHVSPSQHSGLADRIIAIGQMVADAFEIHTSPLIMEMIVDKNGSISIIEAVPDFGGEYIADRIIPAGTGYNFIRESIKAITGKNFAPRVFKQTKWVVAAKFMTADDGTVLSFNPDGPHAVKGLMFSKIFVEPGSVVKQPATNHDRIGVVITKGRTLKDANSVADEAIRRCNIIIKNTSGS